jgi:DNA-binding transcriptional MerR regulator
MPGDEPEGYPIQKLAEKAGVSVRTIRFYINEGLLAAPPVKGRYSVYNDEYLDRLELIRRLKSSFLPLKEIRDRVTSLSWAEVKQALAQHAQQAPQRQDNERGKSALSYINNLLSTTPAPSRMKTLQPAPPQPEAWERLILIPGIELHIRSDASPTSQRLARQIIDYARKLFNTTNQGGC